MVQQHSVMVGSVTQWRTDKFLVRGQGGSILKIIPIIFMLKICWHFEKSLGKISASILLKKYLEVS